MGASQEPLHLALDSNSKGMVLENKGMCKSSKGFLWSKVLKAHGVRQQRRRKANININGGGYRRIFMKRRATLQGTGMTSLYRRPMDGIERRIRTLKKLVPNGQSMGLDGLFQETANYILCLQMKVNVMQILLKLPSECDDH